MYWVSRPVSPWIPTCRFRIKATGSTWVTVVRIFRAAGGAGDAELPAGATGAHAVVRTASEPSRAAAAGHRSNIGNSVQGGGIVFQDLMDRTLTDPAFV